METTRRIGIKMNKNNKTEYPKKALNTSEIGAKFAKKLEEIYVNVTAIPQFNDEEVMLEDHGISFFHRETQKEIAWTIRVCLTQFQEIYHEKVSHVLKNDEFRLFAETNEASLEGKKFTLIKEINGLVPYTLNVIDENGKDK